MFMRQSRILHNLSRTRGQPLLLANCRSRLGHENQYGCHAREMMPAAFGTGMEESLFTQQIRRSTCSRCSQHYWYSLASYDLTQARIKKMTCDRIHLSYTDDVHYYTKLIAQMGVLSARNPDSSSLPTRRESFSRGSSRMTSSRFFLLEKAQETPAKSLKGQGCTGSIRGKGMLLVIWDVYLDYCFLMYMFDWIRCIQDLAAAIEKRML